MNKQKTILAVGSIALDTLETPHGTRQNILGGSATYFSISAGLLAPVKLVGVVGNDYPEEGWQLFQSRNINTDNILVENGSTFRWGGKYSNDYSTRDTLFTELGVFENFSPTIQEADRLSPLVFLGNIHPDLQASVAILNAASELLSEGPEIVVIKKGADGAYIAQGESRHSVPVFPINQVIDPTGAGDSFAGGFMGYLSQADQPDFLEAVMVGSAMASFCVEGFGVESLLQASPTLLAHRVETIKNSMVEKV